MMQRPYPYTSGAVLTSAHLDAMTRSAEQASIRAGQPLAHETLVQISHTAPRQSNRSPSAPSSPSTIYNAARACSRGGGTLSGEALAQIRNIAATLAQQGELTSELNNLYQSCCGF